MTLAAPERLELLALARASIEAALPHGSRVAYACSTQQPTLAQRRSSFVTLKMRGELRGCCGTLEAPRPLDEDVWRNAWAAAFGDPRFPYLTAAEWPHVRVHVSVLSLPEPLAVESEQALLTALRPSLDGLVLELGAVRATFLPAVWQQLQNPAEFVRQLKLKAGWPADFWSPQLRVFRYTTETFGE